MLIVCAFQLKQVFNNDYNLQEKLMFT
jgi:hypothetical protein